MNTHENRAKVKAQVDKYMALARELYPEHAHDIRYDEIDFTLKGVTAGMYQRRNGIRRLRFNMTAFSVEGGEDHLINQTCPHEVAHLVQYVVGPLCRKSNPSHGHIWKRIMRQFGVPAQRCHSLPLPKTRTVARPYAYACACKVHNLTLTIHRKMQNGQRRICRKCRNELTFSPNGSSVTPTQEINKAAELAKKLSQFGI